MSYGIYAVGTKDEVSRMVTKQSDSNTSPEMPTVKAFLLALIESVEGDDKRVVIDANGSHSSGYVTHNLAFRTASAPPE